MQHNQILWFCRCWLRFSLASVRRTYLAHCGQSGIWYFIRIPISCCKSSSYSSWGPQKTWNTIENDIIQNINRQEQLKELLFLKAHTAYIWMNTHKWSRSNRGEALGHDVLLYLFFETRFSVYLSNMRYNTVRFLEFVLDLRTVKRPLVACLVG
jgi:hypothetical protein